jgi:hypothetical protein
MSYVVSVRPEGMLTVTLAYPGEDRIYNAISCRYIPATVPIQGQPHRVVAIEVVHDPATPNPTVAYHRNPDLFERIVLPASALKSVRPYQG